MPSLAFYVAGASSPIGATGLLLAWNRFDRAPSEIDDLALDGVGLYALISSMAVPSLTKAKSKYPIAIPEQECPLYPDGFSLDGQRDLVMRISLKPGGTVLGPIIDLTFDLFENSRKVYGATPDGQSLKVDLADNSLLPAEVTFQDRLEIQAWEDELSGWSALLGLTAITKDIWAELMTPGQPLNWWP